MLHLAPLGDQRPCWPTPGKECPFLATSVCLASASTCAILCDHSGPTTAMYTMPAQPRPHAPVKLQGQLWYKLWRLAPGAGPAYTYQLSRISRLSSQINTSLFCALCPHSCTFRKNFPVDHHPKIALGSSMLNIRVLRDGLTEKNFATCW